MARKTYTAEFKGEAVKVAREARRSGKSVRVLARELGVHPNTLAEWVQTDDMAHAGSGKNTEGLPPEQEVEQLRKENRLLKMEREILEKAAAFFAKENGMNVFEFIDAEKAQYPIGVLCTTLDVSRPGYYAHTRRPASKHATRDAVLGAKIAEIHTRSKQRYGSPRVHEELREEGEHVSRKRVSRLMKERDLCGKRRRRFRVTTQSEHDMPVAPNLLARDFSANAPNQKWVGDITYIWTREGWLYLAVLVDLFSRRVVGWSMSDSLATELPLRALQMATHTRRPCPGLIHHTDRGCQYASADYRAALEQHGLLASMSRKGNCWDNAVAESFFATLKTELVRDIDFLTRDHARREVFAYIEGFYNRRRRHSSVGYTNPATHELKLGQESKAA